MSGLPGLSAALFHPAVGTAQRFLASAFDSVESMLQWQETAAQMAIDMVEEAEDDPDFATRTEETAQDMLRATIVFAGAGLDSAVKQLIHDALPTLLNISTQAADKFVQHVETVIAEQSSTRTLARVLIHAENPRTALIEGYVDALTGSSLQSVEQLDR